jgi:hypothetical protein
MQRRNGKVMPIVGTMIAMPLVGFIIFVIGVIFFARWLGSNDAFDDLRQVTDVGGA